MNIETDTFGMKFDLQLLSKLCSIANKKMSLEYFEKLYFNCTLSFPLLCNTVIRLDAIVFLIIAML